MGCSEGKLRTKEEDLIRIAERNLCFELNSASDIDMVIRKNSLNGVIKSPQLERIGSILRAPTSDLGEELKITKFYNSLRNEEGDIDMKDFLIIGILLSHGGAQAKSRLIYQIFDTESTEELTPKFFRDIVFNKIITLSLRLGTLVSDRENTSKDLIGLYCDSLLRVKKDAINRVVEKITLLNADCITEERFVSAYSQMLSGSLTTATGWRCYMNDVLQSVNCKHEFQVPF